MSSLRRRVPDPRAERGQRMDVGSAVVAAPRFAGPSSARFKRRTHAGQPVGFIANGVPSIVDGRITDRWPLADNLGLRRPLASILQG